MIDIPYRPAWSRWKFGTRAKEVFVDLGYRSIEVPNVTIYKAQQKRGLNTRRLKRALKRRNAIEPIMVTRKTITYWAATTSEVCWATPCIPSCELPVTISV